MTGAVDLRRPEPDSGRTAVCSPARGVGATGGSKGGTGMAGVGAVGAGPGEAAAASAPLPPAASPATAAEAAAAAAASSGGGSGGAAGAATTTVGRLACAAAATAAETAGGGGAQMGSHDAWWYRTARHASHAKRPARRASAGAMAPKSTTSAPTLGNMTPGMTRVGSYRGRRPGPRRGGCAARWLPRMPVKAGDTENPNGAPAAAAAAPAVSSAGERPSGRPPLGAFAAAANRSAGDVVRAGACTSAATSGANSGGRAGGQSWRRTQDAWYRPRARARHAQLTCAQHSTMAAASLSTFG